eukprot:TRINITY_DN3174_c0_g1_i1.p1 TRINITY_DN3174_c0_g1~~TRINITY_DN3174_c0_g1_i1.p1  ORF type:complete len:286 (+),score=82.30 TRINITY_DN3174_c0_g1_i1:71-928(+)
MVEFKDLGKTIADIFTEGWSTNTKLQDKSGKCCGGDLVTTWEDGIGTKLTKKYDYAGVNMEHVIDASQKKFLHTHTGKWGNLSAVLKGEAKEKNVEVIVKESLLGGVKLEASAKLSFKPEAAMNHSSTVTATWVKSHGDIADFGAQLKFCCTQSWDLVPVLALVTKSTPSFPISTYTKFDGSKKTLNTHFHTNDFKLAGAKSSFAALVEGSAKDKQVTNVAVAFLTACCKGYTIKAKLDGLNKKTIEPQVSLTKKEKYEHDTITMTGAWKYTVEGLKFGLSFTKA